jgi:glucosamine--fructose-6-phosphate aminotransferase (isomerizing)
VNSDKKYQKYALCREMLETADVVRNFNVPNLETYAAAVKNADAVMLTGEGSSRIFPAKHSIMESHKKGMGKPLYTEGATQALEYDLKNFCVLGASNSGKTKELIRLFHKLKKDGHQELFGLTAHAGTPLEGLCKAVNVLTCGNEDAVAATKSVAEQALFVEAVLRKAEGQSPMDFSKGGDLINQALTLDIPEEAVQKMAEADVICFAGRNNGVAEELTLKTNEITRKKSDFLEGTYAAHGIEEVMTEKDVIVVIDPFEEEEEKFMECLQQGVGVTLIAVSSRKTSFPYNVIIPENKDFKDYIELAAGWNLLVETGLKLGIDLDNPLRARKVGNEFIPS